MKQILLLLENKANARLLQELLQEHYQVYHYQDEASLNLPFDLCVVDGLALKQRQSQLQMRRQSEEPILLPFLLLTSRPDVRMITDDLRRSVDEVIITPIEKMELRLRIEVLLRARRFSVELACSNQELEEFAYIISHDLQEPLRQIKIFTELLVKRYRNHLDEQADQLINYIIEGVTRTQNLISDLLTYSRVSGGELTLETTDLGAVLHQVLVDLSRLLEENQAMIRVDYLPILKANSSQMRQVLQNLITNAIKFRSPQPPLIQIEAIRNDQFWTISVQDNGIGIEPQYAEQIFVIFQRLHHQRVYPGTGIGLAICKKIVQRHGGRIWFESEPGQGSVFSFSLPASAEAPASGV